MEHKFKHIQSEVQEFITQFEVNENLSKHLKKYYTGTQILYSGLSHKPKLMFIGINPGGGYMKQKGKLIPHDHGLKIHEKHEYATHNYALAANTKRLLKLADASSYLNDSVKANCFFFGTKNENDLYKFLSHLKDQKVYAKSSAWLTKLVDITEPEIIICEGKSAFDRFLKNKECKTSIIRGVHYARYNNIHVIGYKRLFSEILNVKNVALLLKEKIEETQL